MNMTLNAVLNKEYRKIEELRRDLEKALGREIPPTEAELPGKVVAPDPMFNDSCDNCLFQDGCTESGIPFRRHGCSHFEFRGGSLRMFMWRGIHLSLKGKLSSWDASILDGREYDSLEETYKQVGHLPAPKYIARLRKGNKIEILLWNRQVIGTVSCESAPPAVNVLA